jgi:serine/threonine protein kinase
MPKYILSHPGNESEYESDGGTKYWPKKNLGKGAYSKARVFSSSDNRKAKAILCPRDNKNINYREMTAKRSFFQTLYPRSGVTHFKTGGTYRLILPLVPGQKYSELKLPKSPKVRCDQQITLFLSTVTALMDCHQKGYVFVDLKEDNIHYDCKTKKSYLIDGGIAAKIGEVISPRIFVKRDTKEIQDHREKYSYIAPECWSTKEVPARISMDIYSLGWMMQKILGNPVEPRLSALIQSCLALDYSQRPSLDALARKLKELKLATSSHKAPAQPSRLAKTTHIPRTPILGQMEKQRAQEKQLTKNIVKDAARLKIQQIERQEEITKLIIDSINKLEVNFTDKDSQNEVEAHRNSLLKLAEHIKNQPKSGTFLPLTSDQEEKINLVHARKEDQIKEAAHLKIQEITAKIITALDGIKVNFTNKDSSEVDTHKFLLERLLGQLISDAKKIISLEDDKISAALMQKKEAIQAQATLRKESLALLSRIDFAKHLGIFSTKIEEMKREKNNDPNYQPIITKATEFYQTLIKAKENFLETTSNPLFQTAQQTFLKSCQQAIKEASDLKKHPEWKGAILKFIIDVISFLTRGASDQRLGLFAKTDLAKKLEDFEKEFKCLHFSS